MKIYRLAGIVLAAVFLFFNLTSCSSDSSETPDPHFTFTLSPESEQLLRNPIDFEMGGGSCEISFTVDTDWTIEMTSSDESDATWYSLTNDHGVAGEGSIGIDVEPYYENENSLGRDANLSLEFRTPDRRELVAKLKIALHQSMEEGTYVYFVNSGDLPAQMSSVSKESVKKLVLIGKINGTDVKLIRELGTTLNLEKLDLSQATVVEGGEAYYILDASYTHKTKNFMISDCMFSGFQKLTTIELPINTLEIQYEAFADCPMLKSVDIPSSVRRIGFFAFENCVSLTSIAIPDGVKEIEKGTFSNCSSLSSVTIPESVTIINVCAFLDCTNLSSVSLPSRLTNIETMAFSNSGLTSIVIPDSYNGIDIDDSAFSKCANLTSAILPEMLVRIDNYLFADCTQLSEVQIPDGVETIGFGAFQNCTSLTSVFIPESVEQIEGKAFENVNFEHIYLQGHVPPQVVSTAFTHFETYLHIPRRAESAYSANPVWRQFLVFWLEDDF